MRGIVAALVEFRGVRCVLGGREVLRGVDLAVEEGETVVLLGRSGSGKTTLLRMANRLVNPSAGEILFEGRPVHQEDPIRLRRRLGYVMQDAGLFPHWSVARNVGLVPRLEGWEPQRVEARVAEMLAAVGIAELGPRYPSELSGGQRQRAGIARALAVDPPVLLMDEPFAALDPITRIELQRLFLELRGRARKTAIFVTHDVREALRMGTRIALLREGVIEELAAPADFRRSRSPEARAFLQGIEEERDA